MKASDLNREELLKENRRLITNLSRRTANIEGLGLETTPQFASEQFKELKQKLPNKLTELSTKELQTLNRDLRYINSLKTATVKGMKKASQTFVETSKWLNVISEDKKREFFKVYGRLYEERPLYAKFKYEIFNTTVSQQMSGQDLEKLIDDLIREGKELTKTNGGTLTDEEFDILFTSKLREFQQ